LFADGGSAPIAEASFVKTMYQALKLCLPVTLMTFAIFTRFHLVVNPGWRQIGDMLLAAMACWGITYSIFGKFSLNQIWRVIMRRALALASFVVMFHPDGNVALGAAAVVLPATIYGTYRHGLIVRPKSRVESQPVG